MVLPRYGGPELFELRQLPDPRPGQGQLLVRVIASSTNPVEAKIRAGGYWAKLDPPIVVGYDASGVVEGVGEGVTGFELGDEVFYTPEIIANPAGTHAELHVVEAAIVAQKPKSVDHLAAACLPLAGGTAYEALVRRLRLQVGETVLIQGGAGGVGSFAVQIARAMGARVIATAGPDNQRTLRELGADVCVDYRSQNVTQVALAETSGQGVDAVFSTLSGAVLEQSIQAARPFGRLCTILAPRGDFSALYMKNQVLHGVFLLRERPRLEALRALVDRGLVKPLVDRVLPLDQVAEAHRRLDLGHGRGKWVLQVAPK